MKQKESCHSLNRIWQRSSKILWLKMIFIAMIAFFQNFSGGLKPLQAHASYGSPCLRLVNGRWTAVNSNAVYPPGLPVRGHCQQEVKYGSHPRQAATLIDAGSRRPLVVFVPGGGWSGGGREYGYNLLLKLNAFGFSAAAIDYRLLPESRGEEQVADVRAAIEVLQSRTGASEVILTGGSAGGHLALLSIAGNKLKNSNLSCVVSLAAPVDLWRPERYPHAAEVGSLINEFAGPNLEERKKLSPLWRAQQGDYDHLRATRFRLIGIRQDDIVPASHNVELAHVMAGRNIQVDLRLVDDPAGHAIGLTAIETLMVRSAVDCISGKNWQFIQKPEVTQGPVKGGGNREDSQEKQ